MLGLEKSKPMLIIIGLYFALPRVAILLLWALTSIFEPLFNDHIWIILGVVIYPYSFLTYSLGMTVTGAWTPLLVCALVVGLAVDSLYLYARD